MVLIRTNEIEIAQNRLLVVTKCLDTGDHVRLKQIFNYLQPVDAAWLISNLPTQKQADLVRILGPMVHSRTIKYLDRRTRREIIKNINYEEYPDYSSGPDVNRDDFIQYQVFQVMKYLMSNHKVGLYGLFESLKPADAATIMEFLSPAQRLKVVSILDNSFQAEILTFLDSKIREEIIDSISYDTLIHFIADLEYEDIIEILQNMEVHKKSLILHSVSKLISKDDFKLIKKSLSYDKDTAGRIMSQGLVCSADTTVREVYNKFCLNNKLPKNLQIIYINDANADTNHFKLVGQLWMSELCRLMYTRHSRTEPVYKYMQEIPCILYTSTKLSEIGFLFKKYCVSEMPVLNPKNQRMMGTIDCTQALDIIDNSIQDEILSLAGLQEFDFHEGITKTIMTRIGHLVIAAIATTASVSVIHLFDGTVRDNGILAVMMPIAPAIGGNAANQVLTVTVRALSNREIGKINLWRTIKKEVISNLGGGILIGLLVGILCFLYYRKITIASILMIALTANICWAGLLGSGLPILLDQYDRDPAFASVFLNVATDIFGYAVFLGLAKIFI